MPQGAQDIIGPECPVVTERRHLLRRLLSLPLGYHLPLLQGVTALRQLAALNCASCSCHRMTFFQVPIDSAKCCRILEWGPSSNCLQSSTPCSTTRCNCPLFFLDFQLSFFNFSPSPTQRVILVGWRWAYGLSTFRPLALGRWPIALQYCQYCFHSLTQRYWIQSHPGTSHTPFILFFLSFLGICAISVNEKKMSILFKFVEN